ncbi:uncharacterized protein TNCV_3738401 [Trichonephila clavipes]|nr:uncharacterized protein TNCV_3738401 [Trichonephila clavipes]
MVKRGERLAVIHHPQVHSKYALQEPNFEEEIPILYGKDIDYVKPHMDKASSHVSKSTAAYLAKNESGTGIKCILFNEIRVKSSYTSAMDFNAFDLLK